MSRFFVAILTAAAALAFVASSSAEEKAKKVKRPPRPVAMSVEQVDSVTGRLNLTDEQKSKVEDLKKEFAPKIKESQKKAAGSFTDAQKKARDEAVKAAKKARKSRKEVVAAGIAAMKLSDEQKTKMEEGRYEVIALTRALGEKLFYVLTPEQREQLPTLMARKKGKQGPEK